MPKLDFDGLKARLHNDIHGTVVAWIPGGKREANEYVVENPTRSDGKKGSFKINLKTGRWKDFATDDAGGDLIALYAYLKGLSMGDAFRELDGGQSGSVDAQRRNTQAKPKRIPEELFEPMPIGDDTPEMPKYKGKPERVAMYRDEYGRPLVRVCIYRNNDGNKKPVPTSYGRRVWPKMVKCEDGKEKWSGDMFDRVGWHHKAWPTNRPLFGLDVLAQMPKAPVVIGEGEKVAQRLHNALGDSFVCMTWAGGSQAVKKADFRPIFDRDVILCPDYDLSGQKAMLEVAAMLKSQQCRVRLMWEPLDEDRHVKGWDLADEPSDKAVFQYIESALPLEEVERFVVEGSKKSKASGSVAHQHGDGPMDALPAQVLMNQKDLRCLGYDGASRVYFIHRKRSVVVALTPDQLANKNHLFSLETKQFWYDLFPDAKGGMDKDKCSDTLQRWADEIGYFDPNVVRGSGVWPENDGMYVFHMGQKLLVGNKVVPINEFQSEYMYEATNDLGVKHVKPLATGEAQKFLEICNWLDWNLPVFGQLIAGFCVVAPLCGGLDWRPHIWVTGSAGTGKSTVMKHIVKRACGRACLFVQGDSTSAGVRQKLGSDALPVIFDEFEGESPQRLAELQRTLDLARQSSSETGAMMLKGGVQGEAMEFRVRSCFAFSAINVNMTHFADKSRVSVLTLQDPPKSLTEDERNERYASFQGFMDSIETTLTPDYVNALVMRSYALLPVIRKNAKVFGRAINGKLNSQRLGDQLGILCAGAFSLVSTSDVTDEQAEAWCAQYDFEKVAPTDEAKDHDRCLGYILQSIVKIQGKRGVVERTIGELLATVAKPQLDDDGSGDDYTDSQRVLARCGIKLDMVDKMVYIANRNTLLERILSKTPYPSWQILLKRIDGAQPSGKVIRFNETDVSRAVGIPIDVVMHKSEEDLKLERSEQIMADIPF